MIIYNDDQYADKYESIFNSIISELSDPALRLYKYWNSLGGPHDNSRGHKIAVAALKRAEHVVFMIQFSSYLDVEKQSLSEKELKDSQFFREWESRKLKEFNVFIDSYYDIEEVMDV